MTGPNSASVAVAVLTAAFSLAIVAGGTGPRSARAWLIRRSRRTRTASGHRERDSGRYATLLQAWLESAGRQASVRRFLWLHVGGATGAGTGTGLVVVMAMHDVGTALLTAVLVTTGVVGWSLLTLRRDAHARRVRLQLQLAPLLDLLNLELSGGASPGSALAAVTVRCGGELAALLSAEVVASRMAGSPPLDLRIQRLGERMNIDALTSLALVMMLSRSHGAPVSEGVRALAGELRRARRRAVIAAGRQSLNKVLLPSAVAILLPFMAVLMFPAVAGLIGGLQR